jgi:DNA repair protein RadC
VIAAALAELHGRLRQPGAIFDSPTRVREFLTLHLAEREAECFAVMYLDAQHALIEFAVMFEGTLTQTSVYPRELVRHALRVNAGAVVLAHNHPSGNPEPSPADNYLTATLKSALALVDVRVLDHFVIGRLTAVSRAERGLV